jgi:hypothetical protein
MISYIEEAYRDLHLYVMHPFHCNFYRVMDCILMCFLIVINDINFAHVSRYAAVLNNLHILGSNDEFIVTTVDLD